MRNMFSVLSLGFSVVSYLRSMSKVIPSYGTFVRFKRHSLCFLGGFHLVELVLLRP